MEPQVRLIGNGLQFKALILIQMHHAFVFPGPVIAQLDNDEAPEMILTVPTDANGRTSGLGARFIGMEMTSTTEIFNFRTPNGLC